MSTPHTWFSYDSDVDMSNVYIHALRLEQVIYPLLTNALLQHWYNTDSSIHGRLHRPNYIKLFDGNLITGDVNQTMWYEYNGTGRVARTWTHGGGSLDLDRTMATSTGVYGAWDRFGRTLQQKWFRSTTSHADVKHGYDYAGNRLWREDVKAAANSQDHDEFYTYDGLQRLTDAQRGSLTGTYPNYTGVTSKNYEQQWTLDQLGNWPEFKQDSDGDGSFLGAIDFDQDRTHNAVNELGTLSGPNQSSWVGPVHDAAGNMTTIARPKSPGLSFVLTYDAWNRMTKAAATTGYVYGVYEYDGLHHRIVKDAEGTANDREFYYNDKWQVLTETKGGVVQSIYAWHLYYIDALAVRFRELSRHVFLHDANFNVVAAYDVKPTSGTYRQVVERYQYTPYGHTVILNADFTVGAGNGTVSVIDNNYRYTGRESNPETGLYDFRTRLYHPPYGRFTGRDRIDYGGGTNLYEYVSSMPIDNTDPAGQAKGIWNKICEVGRGCWTVGPIDAWGIAYGDIGGDAQDFGKNNGKDRKGCSETNALRHCYWQGRITFEHGFDEAVAIGDAHEYGEASGNTLCDSKKDQHNNRIGREIGRNASSISDIESACLQALRDGSLAVCNDDPRIDCGDAKDECDSSGSSSSPGDSSGSDSSSGDSSDGSSDPYIPF